MNLLNAVSQYFSQALTSVHTAIPAKVVSADPEAGTISAIPTIRLPMENGVEVECPELRDIPVIYPQCAAFDLKFPMAKDDLVLLVFLEVESSVWRGSDGSTPSSPLDTSRFQLGNAVAIPGLYPKPKKGTCTLEVDDQGHITFTASQINFDGQVVFKGDVIAETDVYVGAPGTSGISMLQHIHPTAVGPTSPATPGMTPIPPEK